MPLEVTVEYVPKIDATDISPQNVLELLKDIRLSLGKLDTSISEAGLDRILKLTRSYHRVKIKGDAFDFSVDLSRAKYVLDFYAQNSDGGCRSCVRFARSGENRGNWGYCTLEDPDYVLGFDVKTCGDHTPKVRKHFDNPCDDWQPRFVSIKTLIESAD